MSRPKLLIAESSNFSKDALDLLKERFEVKEADLDLHELKSQVKDFEYLWVRLRSFIDREILARALKLKVIATNTTGLNHIDLEECQKREISVISLRGETDFLKSIRATAELTIGLILAALRNIPAAYMDVIHGTWDRNKFRGREVFGARVGVIGYGRLGKIVSSCLSAMGAEVRISSHGLESGSIVDNFLVQDLFEILPWADIISLHADFHESNLHFFNERCFKAMKADSIFVNTARGELVEELSLMNALRQGRLRCAAIDVIDREVRSDNNLDSLIRLAKETGRLIITPHIGGNTFESGWRTEEFLARKLCMFVDEQNGRLDV